MTSYAPQDIKQLYYSLSNIDKVFTNAVKKSNLLSNVLVSQYEQFLLISHLKYPGLLAQIRIHEYLSPFMGDYYGDAIQTHIGINLGILKSRLEQFTETGTIDEKSFGFIRDDELKKILTRDHKEIQRNMLTQSWKSALILSGGQLKQYY